MRKIYQKPSMKITEVETEVLLVASDPSYGGGGGGKAFAPRRGMIDDFDDIIEESTSSYPAFKSVFDE